ncbi:MAG TPA: copper resistance protein CopC [Ktedonobacteraceae bacterium]|nr:copper resistance protein CopC [Ktedonobacteraceae bacterium]
MQQRRLFVILTALFLSVLGFVGMTLVMQPPAASAHAFVIGSDPVDGSTISKVPSAVHIFFNSSISPLSSAHVYSIQNGNLVEINATPASIASSNTRELTIPLKSPDTQPQGSYEVTWTAVANDDGQTTFGIIGFNVGFSGTGLSGTPILGPSSSNSLTDIRALNTISLLSIGWEWLVFIALTLWIGILVMERLLLPGTEHSAELLTRTRKQTSSLEWLCLAALIFGEFVTLVLRVVRLSQANNVQFAPAALWSFAIQTNYGLLWLIRMILLIVAVALLYWTNQQEQLKKAALASEAIQHKTRSGPLRQQTTQDIPAGQTNTSNHSMPEQLEDATNTPAQPQSYTTLWLLLAGLIAFIQALASNAAQTLQPHLSAIMFDWLNLIAQGIWFGCLVYLGYALLPLLSGIEQNHNAEMLVAVLRRATPFLLTGIGIFLVGDLFLSEASIYNAPQWFTDPYGITLVIQQLILAVILFLSLYTLFILRPRLTRQVFLLPVVNVEMPTRRSRKSALSQTRRHLKQIVNLQIWLSVAILLCAALLSFFAPPIVFPDINYAATTQPTSPTSPQTKQLGDLSVTLQMTPGRIGQSNTVIVMLNDSTGKAVTDAQVQLTTNMQAMDMGIDHASIKGGNAVYSATFDQRTAFNMTGLWTINVQIQRAGQPSVQGNFQVTLSP